MKTKDAIKYYGTQIALAEKLGCSQPTISGWGEYPPDSRQWQIELITGGKLKAEPKKKRVITA